MWSLKKKEQVLQICKYDFPPQWTGHLAQLSRHYTPVPVQQLIALAPNDWPLLPPSHWSVSSLATRPGALVSMACQTRLYCKAKGAAKRRRCETVVTKSIANTVAYPYNEVVYQIVTPLHPEQYVTNSGIPEHCCAVRELLSTSSFKLNADFAIVQSSTT